MPCVKLMLLMELHQDKISVREKRQAFLRGKMVWPYSIALGTQHIFCVNALDESYSNTSVKGQSLIEHDTVPEPAAF